MRKDGYSYVEDKDLPASSKPVWVDADGQSGIGFYKDEKWFWNRRVAGKIFIPIKETVICWRYLENKRGKGNNGNDI